MRRVGQLSVRPRSRVSGYVRGARRRSYTLGDRMSGSEGQEDGRCGSDITRRAFVRAAGAIGLLGLAPPARVRALLEAAPAAGGRGRFLTATELELLSALCDRLVPGPPEDPTPGAVEAGVAQAIDLLL